MKARFLIHLHRFGLVMVCAALLAGCAHSGSPAKPPPPPPPARPAPVKPTLTPVTVVSGKVVVANLKARFVVIDLEPGVVLPVGARVFVYRSGGRIGELRVTGPQNEDKTVADILSGDIRVNDRISDQ